MNRQAEYREDVNSPQSYNENQWNSPPPQFQEHDQIHSAPGMSHVYSSQGSPPVVSPPLPYEPEYVPNPDPKKHSVSQQGYSTEKETPYQSNIGPTPDFSAPQVVPGQFSLYPHRPISHSSPGGTTLSSPHIRPYGFKEHVDPLDAPETAPEPLPTKEERKCGMRKRNFFILIGLLILLVIGLALGLGLGLGLQKDDSKEDPANPICRKNPDWCIGGSLSADYVSKKGVFNGTGLALAGESWNKGQRKLFTLYFQHHTGDIRFMQYSTDQTWLGGTKAQTVASDAKDASPISAVSFAIDATQYVHIFYIDKNNTVKQIVQDNVTSIWQSGPLNELNLKAFDSPSVGLQACWKGNYYGDSDYTKFPILTGSNNTKPFDNIKGMNIWFATSESTFQQYAWYSGHENDTWVSIKPWSGMNGHAGVGCYSWGDGTSSYAMLSNKDNVVEFWWKDTNSSVQSTEAHPINSWVNATEASIAGVHPSTSLGFTTYFYAQLADRTIKGFNVTYASENTTLAETEAFSIADPAGPVKALGGTHLTVTSYQEQKGADTWDSLYVFFQREGDDIAAFTRPALGGQWTGAALNIPDE